MAINLFKDDFTTLSGAELYSEIESFLLLSDSPDSRPQEGERLEYKREWGDTALKTVTALANTFGGLLFVGVEEKDMVPVAMPGVTTVREEKTRIASSIAANISPTPSFDIAECTLPTAPDKHVCIVRVRPSPALYMYTNSGNPIYIRNATESRPANAAQLRYLMERASEPDRAKTCITSMSELLRQQLTVTTRHADAAHPEGRASSESFFRLTLCPLNPVEAISIPLDISLERVLQNSILRRYKQVRECLREGVASAEESRGPEYFSYRWLHRKLDYEMAWAFMLDGSLGFGSQVRCSLPMGKLESSWSIGDVVWNLFRMLDFANEFWTNIGYWGDARVLASLNVADLPMAMKIQDIGGPDGQEAQCYMFGATNVLNLGHVSLTPSPRPCAGASAYFSVGSIELEKTDAVASMLNQILRSMGHSASLKELKAGVDSLAAALSREAE